MKFLAMTSLALGTLVLSSCTAETSSPDTEPETAQAPAPEVRTLAATTTIMGSIANQIGQCAGTTEVEVLMPLGVDPHDYQPSSAQLATIAESGLVVANGLQLEESLVEPLEELESEGGIVFRMVEVGTPLPFGGHDDEQGDEHGDELGEEEHDEHAHGAFDPHFWLDMNRVAEATDALGTVLGDQYGEEFVDCASEVADTIRSTETEMIEILSAIPDQKRVLVTDHDALGYFAERYDFDIAGVVIPGGSTLAEASSQDLAALVQEIENRGLEVMFGNFHVPSDLLDAVAEESGGLNVVPLYIGSIGEPGSEQETYQDMMLFNARQIAAALGN